MPVRYIPTRYFAYFLLISLLLLGLFIAFLSFSHVPLTFNFQLDQDWNEGFRHPLTGWDHVLVMVAVGVWAAQIRGQAL
ncbi:MAG: HupE/UreJ family protein, partial [Nitrosomonas sp.]|nr:HupE/UreJ family protein [Nitrosomonas sp.]